MMHAHSENLKKVGKLSSNTLNSIEDFLKVSVIIFFSLYETLTNLQGKVFECSATAILINPFPKQQILVSFRLKEFADDNFKFDENGRKLSKQVENTVGKGEIAH